MMFKGRNAQISVGGILRGAEGEKVKPNEDNSASMIKKGMGFLAGKAVAGAPGAASAIGAIGGVAKGLLPGIGFGLGANLTSNITGGLTLFFVAALFDFMAFFAGNTNLLIGLMMHAVGAFFLLRKFLPGDGILKLIIYFKLAAIALLAFPGMITLAPEVYRWIGLTVANHAFPILFLYIAFTGFIFNRGGGKIATAIYAFFFFLMLALAYTHAEEQINEAFEQAGLEVSESFPEQENVFRSFLQKSASALKKTTGDLKEAVAGAPKAIERAIDPRIAAAGGEELFGEPKEMPKLGIVIQEHPSGAIELKDSKIVKALITVINPLEDSEFITVSNIRCWHEKSKDVAEVEGTLLDVTSPELVSGIKVFYNRPRTVSCEFTNEQLQGASSVKIAADYKFQESVRLATYFMKDELLESMLIKKENPLDYIATPQSKRRPSPHYDNGPARLGIGPIEFRNPPFGIKEDEAVYPAFEFIIGNKADFNGVIKRLNSIVVTLPKGVYFKEEASCGFTKTTKTDYNEYKASYGANENKLQFENIKSSRLFVCDMDIKRAEALPEGAPFAEAEFIVDVDFTYETEKSIRLT